VLRRIFGLERDEMLGGWRKLQNYDIHNLYSSLNTIILIKSRSMRWARHLPCMARREMHRPTGFW
jgi:hypothetical protein